MLPAPTSPESESRAGEGLSSSRGRFRPRPFGPGRSLGFLPKSEDFFRFPSRTSIETLLSLRISGEGFRRSKLQRIPLRGSVGPKAPVFRRTISKKVGSACASRFFFCFARSAASSASILADLRRVSRRPPSSGSVRFRPALPGRRRLRLTRPSESRQAESFESRLWITGISWISPRFRAAALF